MRARAALLVVALAAAAAVAASCFLEPVDLTGKRCASDDECGAGLACVADACAKGGDARDAGRPVDDDGGAVPDGGALVDAGFAEVDGGAVDGGQPITRDGGFVVPDAGTPDDGGPGPCDDDAEEDNDSIVAPAVGVPSATALMLCAGDEDWFSIQVNAGQRLTVTISFTHADGDLALEVYDPIGTSRGGADGVTDQETFQTVATQTGGHFVRVLGVGASEQTAYALTYSIDNVAVAATLNASATTLPVGRTTQLVWTSTNAASCSIDQGIGTVALNGTLNVAPVADVVYTLTCTGPGGTTNVQASIDVPICARVCDFDFTTNQSTCATCDDFDDAIGTCANPDTIALPADDRWAEGFPLANEGSGFYLEATICDPRGVVLNVGDSPGNNGGGGDDATTCNDAELQLVEAPDAGAAFAMFANEIGFNAGTQVLVAPTQSVPRVGCSTFRLLVEDRVVQLPPSPNGLAVTSDYAIRFDKPACDANLGQRDIWVGFNRVILLNPADRIGSGVRSARVCLR